MKNTDEKAEQADDTWDQRLDQRKKEIEQAAVIAQADNAALLKKTMADFHSTLLNPENNIEPER